MAAHSLSSSVQDLIGEGWIGPVHCGGREIIRRIFITVRDRNWLEVQPTKFESVIDQATRTVRLSARHTSELVDFEWQGDLTISEDGRDLSLGFKGQALRDMEVCRLGLIVLHPLDSMIGSRVTASSEQAEQTFTVDEQLAPQPIVDGIPGAMTEPFTELRIEREDWGLLILSFEGDSFELEDQRNWGDATFKTYCTPLRKGFPRAVTKGTSIAHRVAAHFVTLSTKTAPSTPVITSGGGPGHERAFKAEVQQRLPEIGRISSNASPSALDELGTWDHIQVDLTDKDPSALRSVLEASSCQLEIAVEARSLDQGGGMEWVSLIHAHRERIARIIFYGPGTALPSESAIELWHNLLNAGKGRFIPLVAATRGYFVEFNRAVPFVAPITGIAFPLTATVHSDDAQTVMSNVATIGAIAKTGRHLTRTSDIALLPLALYHPPAAASTKLSDTHIVRWLMTTLRRAVAARVTSITLADDVASALEREMGVSCAGELRHLMASEDAP